MTASDYTMTYSGAASSAAYSQWLVRSVYNRDDPPTEGEAGVREPRRPIQPRYSGGATLPLPVDAEPIRAHVGRL
jgi:hypothetical protein